MDESLGLQGDGDRLPFPQKGSIDDKEYQSKHLMIDQFD